jgi:hypothetical protein
LEGWGWGNKWFTYSKERKGDKKKRDFFLNKKKIVCRFQRRKSLEKKRSLQRENNQFVARFERGYCK